MQRVAIRDEERYRKHYSTERRKLVIYQRHTLDFSIPDIARNLNMSRRVVEHTLQLWRLDGEILDNRSSRQRKKVMKDHETEFLLTLLESNPDLYLDEIQEELQTVHGVIVSRKNLWDTLKELGLTRKKLSQKAGERNKRARDRYCWQIGSESPNRLVLIDECRIDCRTTYRMNGWTLSEKRVGTNAKFVRGHGYSLLSALCEDGVVFAEVRDGTYDDGPAFIAYIEKLLERMNAWPSPRSVLVMDNCAIRHVDDIQPLCQAKGVRLYFLPPYSPDLNPGEEAFSYIKGIIQRHGPDFRAACETTITPSKVQRWMGHSGYLCIVHN